LPAVPGGDDISPPNTARRLLPSLARQARMLPRSLAWKNTAMPPTEIDPALDPDSPVYAPVRAALARLFILHRAELGMHDWSDERIVAETDFIMMALMACSTHAVSHDDRAWMERHRWFGDVIERLFADQASVPLDA
jgi:hypothetical protein